MVLIQEQLEHQGCTLHMYFWYFLVVQTDSGIHQNMAEQACNFPILAAYLDMCWYRSMLDLPNVAARAKHMIENPQARSKGMARKIKPPRLLDRYT